MFEGMTWIGVSDHDPRVAALYSRHYSSQKSGKATGDWLRYGIAGPGEHLVLLTLDAKALFGWIKTKFRDDGQEGIHCFVFRNESEILSSLLVREAEPLAQAKWPGERRLWTYVNPGRISSPNPGFCFKQAGWTYAGQSPKGLHILEKIL